MSCEALRFSPCDAHSEFNRGGMLNGLAVTTYPIRSQKQIREGLLFVDYKNRINVTIL